MPVDAKYLAPPATTTARALTRVDAIPLAVLAAGYALAVLLMPVAHNFAYLDDWTYARAVDQVLQGAGFVPSQYAQATLVTTTYWGALFAGVLGPGFSSLTAATMVASLLGAAAFYLLLRRLGHSPGLSSLGLAILVLNPYYLILSYSFMTEIPFLALLLWSCLSYLIGFQEGRRAALWGGSLCAALAYLTRQFGLVLPLAALLWLFLAHQWTGRRALAVGALPLLALAGYALYTRQFGPTLSASIGREEIVALLRPFTWLQRASHFVYLAAFLPGLVVPLWPRVRHRRVIVAAATLAVTAVWLLWQVKNALVASGASIINELSYTWIAPSGIPPLLVYGLGTALTVGLAGSLLERGWARARALLTRRTLPRPEEFLVLVAGILFAGTYLVSAGFLDRYWLPILPFVIAGSLAPFAGATWRRLLPVLAVLAIVAGYGVVVHLDDYAAHSAAWAAGRALVTSGVRYSRIRSYAGWEGYYLGDESLQQLGFHDIATLGRVFPPDQIIDPAYWVSPDPVPGYRVLASFPYLSLREGGRIRSMLALQRTAP